MLFGPSGFDVSPQCLVLYCTCTSLICLSVCLGVCQSRVSNEFVNADTIFF